MLSVSMLTSCGINFGTTGTQQETGTDAATEAATEAVTEAATEASVEDQTAASEEETSPSETEVSDTESASADLGDEWVNMDQRSFAVNGNVYTLGETTLQEMIDDGVPFDEDDLANAGNNLGANRESAGFSIVLGEYYNAQVYVINDSEENMTTSDCKISEIYLPVDLEESNDILTFSFPLTMTEEELEEQAGEPTDFDNYEDGDYIMNTYDYKVDSTKYYGDSGYEFEFINEELEYVTIDWMP